MEWKEFEPGYWVSNHGQVKGPTGSLNLCDCQGYYRCYVKKMRSVSRLVARAFVHNPRPDIFDLVDHIDRNTHNNHHTNLRWLNNALNTMNNGGKCYTWSKQHRKWKVEFRVMGKNRFFGYYILEEAAAAVAKRERARTFQKAYCQLVGHNKRAVEIHSSSCGAAAKPGGRPATRPRQLEQRRLDLWLSSLKPAAS